jgi:PadR family transcriptional regulator PadR
VEQLTESLRKGLVQRIGRNLLDIHILRLIRTQPMWGYGIKKRVETIFGLRLRHGTLYSILNNLEQKGFLAIQEQQHGGRRRKIYAITDEGRRYLETYEDLLKEQLENEDIKQAC